MSLQESSKTTLSLDKIKGSVIPSRRIVWFEGADNCGKSTVVKEVGRVLAKAGNNVKTISQPRSCQLGEIVYNLHHDYEGVKIEGFARQLLHVASHIQGYREMENDNLHIMLSDRSFLSSMAYGYAFPHTEETKVHEVSWIWNIEAYLIPDKLIPTHVIRFINKPHEATKAEYENYEKVSKGYNFVFTGVEDPGRLDRQEIPESTAVKMLKERKTRFINIDNAPGKLPETVDTIIAILTNDYDERWI